MWRKPVRRSLTVLVVTLVGALAGPAGVVQSGIITSESTSGPGLGSASVSFTNVPSPFITYTLHFANVAFVDFAFGVTDSAGTTTYVVDTRPFDTVFNDTAVSWTDYHLALGFGTGSSFILSTSGDGLDFLSSPAPTSTHFTNLSQTTDTLSWSGGIVPTGGAVDFSFSFTVPDGITGFTLRQLPTVAAAPEPSTLLLFGFGFAGLIAEAWKRHRRK